MLSMGNRFWRAALLAMLTSQSITAVFANSAQESLLRDIKQAQQQLQQSTEQVSQQRKALGQKLFNQSQQVHKLREQAAVAQRVLDEQSLSLNSLQQRLAKWQEQSQYQQHLLSQFGREQSWPANLSSAQQIAQLQQLTEQVRDSLQPQWQATAIVAAGGQVHDGQLLNFGPVQLYRLADDVGLASSVNVGSPQSAETSASSAPNWQVLLPYSASQAQSWLAKDAKAAELLFDPTQSQGVVQAQQQESLWQHLQKGGFWVWPIVGFALFALVIAIFKALQLWRLPNLPSITGLTLLTEQPERWAGLAAAGQLLSVWQQRAVGQQRDDELFNVLMQARERLERLIGAVAVTASVAPLLGLLGTVSGMIETFKMMTLFGAGDPQVVSGGISQALITTELGLVVAIPALIGHALLNRQAKAYYQQLESLALGLSQHPNSAVSPVATQVAA